MQVLIQRGNQIWKSLSSLKKGSTNSSSYLFWYIIQTQCSKNKFTFQLIWNFISTMPFSKEYLQRQVLFHIFIVILTFIVLLMSPNQFKPKLQQIIDNWVISYTLGILFPLSWHPCKSVVKTDLKYIFGSR